MTRSSSSTPYPHPEDHPLFARQLALEEAILDGGVTKFRADLARAKKEGRFSETLPGCWMISNLIDPLAERIKTFVCDSLAGKPGPGAVGAPILNRLEPDAVAFIALRAVLSHAVATNHTHHKSTAARRIVAELREEVQHRLMAQGRVHTFKYWTEQIKHARHRVTRCRLRKKLKANFPDLPSFTDTAGKLALHSAAEFLIQAVVEVSGVVTIEVRNNKIGDSDRVMSFIELLPGAAHRLAQIQDKAESLFPRFEPLVCPPRPWTGAYQGGFVGALGQRTRLIHTNSSAYLEDVHNDIGQLDQVLRAVNALQATAWRVNRRLYDVLKTVAAMEDGQRYGVPSAQEIPYPLRPPECDTDKRAALAHIARIKAAQQAEAIRVGHRAALDFVLRAAQRYQDYDAIWFAHRLDWRGRVYPMSSYLSPQGNDTSRALLEFAEGLPLQTEEAARWLAIHGAGVFGYDKVSFADRLRWVADHEAEIRASAAAPLDCGWWTQADKPWMFLAFCFDWVGYLDEGLAHVSHLPVAMDGSCNGLQNFAAMLRHPETARLVNLTPSAKPEDIYQRVADVVTAKLEEIARSSSASDQEIQDAAQRLTDMAIVIGDSRERGAGKRNARVRKEARAAWDIICARWLRGAVDRKLVKRPVMTYPYSVTMHGMAEQLAEILDERILKGTLPVPEKHVGKAKHLLKRVVFASVQEVVVAAAEAMRWLRAVAGIVARDNLPVKWTSPIGLPVVQHYWESDMIRISLVTGGIRYRPFVKVDDETRIHAGKQAAGVSPNFVHSCDASHLMFTVLSCRDKGITSFHMIHDSYGCHAHHAATLARTLREEFVKMYDGSILARFRDQLVANLTAHPESAASIPPPPPQGALDLSLVLQSPYFFA